VGTWDLGPFDNDVAADWCDDLDQAPKAERAAILRETFAAAIDDVDYLERNDGSEVVAAAAVVAAHQANARRIDTPYAPDFLTAGQFLDLPEDLSLLAAAALDRVTALGTELRDSHAGNDLSTWLTSIALVRAELHGDT
jgi:hypothetical protein